MNEYFRAIGFGRLKMEQLRLLSEEVKRGSDMRCVWGGDGPDMYCEHFKYYGENMGVLVRGKMDEYENETDEVCMPIYLPELEIRCSALDVANNGVNYTVSYESGESSKRMAFSLQNAVDYLKNKNLKDVIPGIAGLSLGGTILLPVSKKSYSEDADLEKLFYRELLQKARTGDYLAQQILNVKVQRTVDSIRRRLYNEDILSIIEGFIMPTTEDCMYFIMGNITSLRILPSNVTAERIYRLTLVVAGTEVDVVVNGGALVGMPMVGMRFLGSCWLQGRLNFQ